MKTVSIFCSSSAEISPIFSLEMEKMMGELQDLDIRIAFGGVCEGTMGVMANSAQQKKIPLLGVYMDGMEKGESFCTFLQEKIQVPSLAERKNTFYNKSDAFIIFPGGIGTMDEWMDLLARQFFVENGKPVLLYNPVHFWDSFLMFFAEMSETGFIRSSTDQLFKITESPRGVKTLLQQWGWKTREHAR